MLHLITGNQGSGKTLYLVKKAFEEYKAGKTIYSNVALKFPYKKLNLKDILECKLKNGVVIWDEIHINLSARNSMSSNSKKICQTFLSQIRKADLVVYASSQKPRKVEINFREETDYHYICSKYGFIDGSWRKIMHNQNLKRKIPIMIAMEIEERFTGQMIQDSFIANEYFSLYDTKQIIKIEGLE